MIKFMVIEKYFLKSFSKTRTALVGISEGYTYSY
jgi:hypothetical protein